MCVARTGGRRTRPNRAASGTPSGAFSSAPSHSSGSAPSVRPDVSAGVIQISYRFKQTNKVFILNSLACMSAADSPNRVEFDGQPQQFVTQLAIRHSARVLERRAATERVSTARQRDGGRRFDAVHDVWAWINRRWGRGRSAGERVHATACAPGSLMPRREAGRGPREQTPDYADSNRIFNAITAGDRRPQ